MNKIVQPSFSVITKQVVVREVSTQPYVGFEHLTTLPDGWLYDIKRWSSLFDLVLPTIPKYLDAPLVGVSESQYFQSGVGSIESKDLLVKKIAELFSGHERFWAPLVNHGYYYRYKTRHYLYGDNSRVQYIDSLENDDGKNYIELDVKPDTISPITAVAYKRNPLTLTPEYFIETKQQYSFTGVYVDGEEQVTVSPVGRITWGNVDYTKKEFIVDDTQNDKTILRFNRDFITNVGVEVNSYDDLGALEEIGISNAKENMTFRLLHFPVLADNTFELYIADSIAKTYQKWQRVNSWWDLYYQPEPYVIGRYYLDKDLGIIHFGDHQGNNVPAIGKSILVAYNTTLRVEYEEEAIKQKHVTALSANVNPLGNHINQGFVCITHDELIPTSITLDMDKQSIPFTHNPKEYGPIIVGNDFGLLRATVTSQTGIPISKVNVNFFMNPSTIGFLNGAAASDGITNASGHAFSTYTPPVAADTLGEYSITVRDSIDYPGNKEIIIDEGVSLLEKESEVYIYQVIKNDLLLGYTDLDSWIEDNIEEPAWVTAGGAEELETWKNEIIEEYDLAEWFWDESTRTMNGRKVVIYQIINDFIYPYPGFGTDNLDPEAINPITDIPGAVIPLRPILIEKIEADYDPLLVGKYRVVLPEDAIPDPDPTDPNNLVGGYWVVSSRLVSFRAKCYSSFYNSDIFSNEIVARISLPNYLLGEYIAANLDKIPFGWKLLDDLNNIAAGLDGATFITINPTSGPYQILDLVNGTSPDAPPDGWAQAPFKSLGFLFQIAPLWLASTSYTLDELTQSTDGDVYKCITAGTTGTIEPIWNTTTNDTTADNIVVWIKV